MTRLKAKTKNSELEANVLSKEPRRIGHPQGAPAKNTLQRI